jgi:hypothetical protein
MPQQASLPGTDEENGHVGTAASAPKISGGKPAPHNHTIYRLVSIGQAG